MSENMYLKEVELYEKNSRAAYNRMVAREKEMNKMTKCKCELDGCTALCSCDCHDEKYELLDDDTIVIRKFDDDGAMPFRNNNEEV